jgi:hypothetical protein
MQANPALYHSVQCSLLRSNIVIFLAEIPVTSPRPLLAGGMVQTAFKRHAINKKPAPPGQTPTVGGDASTIEPWVM